MNLWQKTAIALFRWLMVLVLVLNITSCGGEKAVSQEPLSSSSQENVQLSRRISEVSPPATIQELRQTLEVYQPQVTIVAPKPDEVLQDNTVSVRFQIKDLPIYKDPEFELGPHLHVILDNEPYIAVYDLGQPLILRDLSPGTHTLRVFASRPWHESFKNEGAYAQATFHILTKTDDNNPDPTLPLLTYSRPKGSYGAEPILLDFYLTNAPLHLVAQENSTDKIADWRIRCTINGESFVLDRWQSVYLKGFQQGKNWVKLEFLDAQGNPVKNVFNSTVRLITYEPKGKDTLSKIVRGELSADQVRKIVDPNYTAKIPVAQPTPTPTVTPTVEATPEPLKQVEPPVPEAEPTPIPTATPSGEEKQTAPETASPQAPSVEPEKPKSGGFFNRFPRQAEKTPIPQTTPSLSPTTPEIIESPQPETTLEPQPETPKAESTTEPEKVLPLEETPKAQSTTEPEKVAPQPETKGRFSRYFQRRAENVPTPTITAEPSTDLPSTLPEIVIESPASESVTPQTETTVEAQPEETPKADTTTLPIKVAPQPEQPDLKRFFNRRQYSNAAPSPTLPQTPPDVIKLPSVPETLENATTPEPQSGKSNDDS